jgi:glyoxylase-like metal-dependent hydrolase (beta-lactamase superfamily II)
LERRPAGSGRAGVSGADLQLALELADKADAITTASFRRADLVVETKPDMTPVTDADRGVERALRDELSSQRPDDRIAGEEFGDSGGAGVRRWIIDPIDGTKNFVRGIPVWATLIALEGEVGVVSAPALGRRWWATRGGGAFAGGQPIAVSKVDRLEDAQVSHGGLTGWESQGGVDRLVLLAGPGFRRLLVAHAGGRGGLRDRVGSSRGPMGSGCVAGDRRGGGRDVYRSDRRGPGGRGQRHQQQRSGPRRRLAYPSRWMSTYLSPGVLEIDTLLGGWSRITAGYLIEGPAPVRVETGSQSSVAALLEALEEHGVAPNELAGVAVTHIHLDHAGGVGDVARAFPNSTVYVHEKGARHLVDPSRLINSAAQVYGDLLDSLYGRLDPTPSERIHVLEDGEDIEIGGGRVLTTIDSPGHAKHHLALHDSESGILFAGDAVGVRLPDLGVLRPATPPADFDLDQALNSLSRFRERRPNGVALAHYGLLPEPMEMLEEASETLRRWAEVAEKAWRAGEDIASALSAEFSPQVEGIDPDNRAKLETLNGIHSNAAGLRLWLENTKTHPAGGH